MLKPILAGVLLLAAPVFAQQVQETIEVTATRIAEDVLVVPASVTVIDGDDIRARNATDLASALSLVAGVNAMGGSDAGPASGVPEMWGLREVDAFLLVVDGVPWGGAFNPDLPTLDLTGVDRIEVVRGSAPVMYGATSFIGVIHVIHREAGAPGEARFSLGTYGSGGIAASVPLSQSPAMRQSIVANVERRGFDDDRTQVDRVHGLYRLAFGNFHLDADASLVRQDPGSPHPRQGPALSALVPVGANHNPDGAHLDENRLQLSGTWANETSSVTLAFTHSDYDILRGFLTAIDENDPNGAGFSQDREVNDLYFDAHRVIQPSPVLRAVVGVDHLYGSASADNELGDYFVRLDGHDASELDLDEENHLEDRRNFSGAYASAEWSVRPNLRVDGGLRLNHTSERREGEDEDARATDSVSDTRLSGGVGVNWLLWKSAARELALFADYRNTYKPAALDFGPEAEGEILDAETAQSWEVGAKGAFRNDRLRWTLSAFRLNFANLVVPTVRDGLPALENVGGILSKGWEAEIDWRLARDVKVDFGYSYHDTRFEDYVQSFDGVPTQLRGKRFEMSPFHLLGAGVTYAPASGWNGNVVMNYVGARYLNKRNTAPADPYTIWSAGIGRNLGRGELRLDAHNIFDKRPPVGESELGDAQYYRLAAQSIEVSYRMKL
jgi:outer membrane receptor protein involved in Fe transport